MKVKVELLSPAGNFEKLKYALAYGADAVYAGIPRYSLRARENDFSTEILAEAIEYCHQSDRKIYLTLNIFPHNRKIEAVKSSLTWLAPKTAGCDYYIRSRSYPAGQRIMSPNSDTFVDAGQYGKLGQC